MDKIINVLVTITLIEMMAAIGLGFRVVELVGVSGIGGCYRERP
jgi:hypothetical protein